VPMIDVSFAAALLLAAAAVAWRHLAAKRAVRIQTERAENVVRFVKGLHLAGDREGRYNALLEYVGTVVEAPVYAYYEWAEVEGRYALRAIRHYKPRVGRAAPSYSGLIPYQGEAYLPPTSLPKERGDREPWSWLEDAGTSVLQLTLQPARAVGIAFAVVVVGPLPKPKAREERRIAEAAELLAAATGALAPAGAAAVPADAADRETATAAWRSLGRMVSDPSFAVAKAFRLCAAALGLEDEPPPFGATKASAPSGEASLAFSKPSVTVTEESMHPGAYRIVCKVPTPEGAFVRAFRWSNGRNGLRVEHVQASLRGICREAEAVFRAAARRPGLESNRALLLKRLARLLDAATPWTVGQSEMASRYATLAARELGLATDRVRDVALAAYLSRLGWYAVSDELAVKTGLYSKEEAVATALHAEAGAAAIELALGNARVAGAMRPRWTAVGGDGATRTDAATVEARIVAVARRFAALLQSRTTRDSLTFEDALKELQSAAGAGSLDRETVEALVAWFRRKRAQAGPGLFPLGACWEMCCAPTALCEACPAFQRRDLPCWEQENRLCAAHGKSCSTCFVYTEATARTNWADIPGKII